MSDWDPLASFDPTSSTWQAIERSLPARCVCGHSRASHSSDGICLIGDGPDDPHACPCCQFGVTTPEPAP